MLNLSDNELDKLSREAAENFEPAENIQSWNKLEQLLDKNLGKPAPVPRRWRPSTGLMYCATIIVAIAVTYFLIKSNKNSQTSTLPLSVKNQQQPDNKPIVGPNTSTPGKPNSQKLSGATVLTQNGEDKADSRGNGETHPGKKATGSTAKEEQDGLLAGNNAGESKESLTKTKLPRSQRAGDSGDLPIVGAGVKDIAGREPRNKESSPLGREADAGKIKGEKMDDNGSGSGVRSPQDYAQEKNGNHQNRRRQHNKPGFQGSDTENKNAGLTAGKSGAPSSSVEITEQGGVQKLSAMTEIQRSQVGSNEINDSALRNVSSRSTISNLIPGKAPYRGAFVDRSLEFGFSFAPEFSKVKYIYSNNRIGNSIGLTLGYRLSGKLSVNSGVLLSEKYYQVNSQQFHGPADAAGTSLHIEFVNASASVIDIPLNLRYNYFSDGNSTFFVNGGFSSYLMKKENFNYFCQYDNGVFQYERWIHPERISPPQRNYLFSIINLSTGFQTSISNSLSFQFEPYMKIPVKEIGFGKVNLSSYGINISLKYAPVLKRGRR